MLLYHATKQGNVGSIVSKGLLPDKRGRVHLSLNTPNALEAIAGRGWKEISVVCVSIDYPSKPNKDGDVIHPGRISPNHIVAVKLLIKEQGGNY